MNKSVLIAATALMGVCFGCSTGPEDVTEAELDYQQARQDAEQIVADARRDGAHDLHETRKIALDDIYSEDHGV